MQQQALERQHAEQVRNFAREPEAPHERVASPVHEAPPPQHFGGQAPVHGGEHH
jgi:hypothetical protein